MQKSERGQVDGATPWVTFPLELLDGLASQLAAVASSGARWRQDAPAPDMGTTIGVYAKKIPLGA